MHEIYIEKERSEDSCGKWEGKKKKIFNPHSNLNFMYADILTVLCLPILTCKCTFGKSASETLF